VYARSSVAARRLGTCERGAIPAGNERPVARLAQFFPTACPLRLPVRVAFPDGSGEKTLLEYATAAEVLFASARPLRFGERLRLSNSDRSLDVNVVVVALQFQGEHMAAAVRFVEPVANWIVKP